MNSDDHDELAAMQMKANQLTDEVSRYMKKKKKNLLWFLAVSREHSSHGWPC